jgi:2,3-bisphosphoglycerate-independent phosphoglycerate mutase
MILDGFGIAPDAEGNAISRANMPNFKRLVESFPAMTVHGSGGAVGLSWGDMGNSEVGHLTIGAGKIFYQSLPRINLSIENKEFFSNQVFLKAVEHVKQSGGKLHLMGLLSQGNVHASQAHLHALLDFCKQQGLPEAYIHAFLDGRDAIFNSAETFMRELAEKIQQVGIGKVATMAGRYYAMDRDNRWDRVELAYKAMVLGQGEQAASADEALQASYKKEIYDEQFVPTVIMENGAPVATIQEHDAVIFFNFRPDRAREIAKAFTIPAFDKFERAYIQDLLFVTMTEYEKGLPVEIAFPPYSIDTCLAKVVSDAGLRQLHIAETEKYAHVTFFLNGMREEEFPGEERVIIPSPRVSSYDQQPEMSAYQITERVVKEIAGGQYDLIVMNFANPDMVAHTGNYEATLKANEVIDQCIGQIAEAALAVSGAVVITADHGNAEEVSNLVTGDMDKEHSTNPVPFIIVQKDLEGISAPSGDVIGGDLSLSEPVGMLADVAPTIIKMMELEKPEEMTGESLL